MPVEEPFRNGRTFLPSVNQVLRELKKQEVGLYNCVCSVLSDIAFVREISLLYSHLPLLANLRCGLWYAPEHDSTCYFKSTDGHYGNWGFSCTRLNLHTAGLAAERGGCIIVDATRRGKSFPVSGLHLLVILCRARNMCSIECHLLPPVQDAFTKTVPIWCTVLNRAISTVRQQLQQERCASGGGKPEAVSQSPGWDCDLHLPAWVSANEANHISMRLDSWAQEFLQVAESNASFSSCHSISLPPEFFFGGGHQACVKVTHRHAHRPFHWPSSELILKLRLPELPVCGVSTAF